MGDITNPVILIVEDEPAQLELLRYNLEKEDFNVEYAENGQDALLLVMETLPDLILLDWMLPDLSGIKVCRNLKRSKKTQNIPVIMLTARGEEEDRVRGLDIGADDYVVKPYSVKELVARVRAILRRTRPGTGAGILSHGDIQVDTLQHTVSFGKQDVILGPTEFRLLTTFLESPGRVWSRDQLLDRVWGREADVDTRTVDVHVGRLRKALGGGKGDGPIRTERGFGYALKP
ncbi:MAG: phosphate regulon transcriptional regulatory protein PhoB [Rhodobacteraceae bacterium]|nr:phosphate regulon transcriptional regulatory protein PhoB [Paracoccaceae bacterium]